MRIRVGFGWRRAIFAGCLALVAAGGAPGWAASGLDARPNNTTCLAGDAPGSGPTRLERVWPELNVSVFDVRLAPGTADEFYVVDRTGKMYRFKPGSAPVLVLNATAKVGLNNVDNAYLDGPPWGSENWGLVSVALHPNFQQNGWVFLLFNGRVPGAQFTTSRVVRYTMNAARTVAGSELEIINQPQPDGYLHHFGQLAFGPDGFLYVGSGDGILNGPTYFPSVPAQKLSDLRGKILRLNVNNSTAAQRYTNPAGNLSGGRPEIYALGVRNPWRFSFDSQNGELWVGDVGMADWEEVSIVPKTGNRNMGWNVFEGNHCRTDYPGPGNCTTINNTVPALAEINHGGKYMSVTGGFVYRGSALPGLYGKYVFALYGPNAMYTVTRSGTLTKLLDTPKLITAFFTDAQNELYAIAPWDGLVYKLVGGSGSGGGSAAKLSGTGCLVPNTVNMKGTVPFAVKSQLWSDGSNKKRWVALPNGKQITVQTQPGRYGDFDFPNGSVLIKSFLFQGKPFETRLLKHHNNGSWEGYSYKWDADGKDATLVDRVNGLATTVVNNAGKTIAWKYPSAGECKNCHTVAAGLALGPEIAQINGNFTYPATGRTANQLETWSAIGLFDGPLPADQPSLADYTNTTLPAADRARSYLHANCSFCHRPDNTNTQANMDLRYRTAFAGMNICNATPVSNAGDLGVAGAKLFTPGKPALSIIPLRMRSRPTNQMPPLGSNIAHGVGFSAVEAWIRQTTACP